MAFRNRNQNYIPDPETIARGAAEIQRENIEWECVDDIVPERIERRGGPKVLLLSIIRQAVVTLEDWWRRHGSFEGSPRAFEQLRRNARIAYQYVMNDAADSVTSFRSACEITDADPEAIRERALRGCSDAAVEALFARPQRISRRRISAFASSSGRH